MKAVQIDMSGEEPVINEIDVANVSPLYLQILQLLGEGVDTLTAIPMPAGIVGYADDEGLFKNTKFWTYPGAPQTYAGNAVFFGDSGSGQEIGLTADQIWWLKQSIDLHAGPTEPGFEIYSF